MGMEGNGEAKQTECGEWGGGGGGSFFAFAARESNL